MVAADSGRKKAIRRLSGVHQGARPSSRSARACSVLTKKL
jgi:hypothetical protein